MLHLALDVGGAFTDICLFDDREGATRVAKVSPAELARRYQEAKIGTFELIRRYGVILDWGTGELLPKTTEGFRAMLKRRVVPHWKNGSQES
jgi:N-methylhydantoinase B